MPARKRAKKKRGKVGGARRQKAGSRKGQRKARRRAAGVRPARGKARARAGRRSRRVRYTDQQRRHILATARREGLTATEVQKRFGVSRVTYYAWRKERGAGRAAAGRGRGRPARVGTTALDGKIAQNLRRHVRAQIAAALPEIVREELASYFSVGRRGRRRGRRR